MDNYDFTRISILLVEDDESLSENFAAMLRHPDHSYRVTVVRRASDALAMLNDDSHEFQLVIANITMKDMDIHDFAAELNKNLTKFLVTCPTKDYELVDGCYFYIEMPISFPQLGYLWQHAYRQERRTKKTTRTAMTLIP